MSFDKGKYATVLDVPPRNDRRAHIARLHVGVMAHKELADALIERRGVSWVSVARYGSPRRTAEFKCGFRNSERRFYRTADGSTGTTSAITGTLDTAASELAAVAP
ncbi:hypothetical protein [Actinomadura terrae]|uniref:hypothetical protein n=1 Tax=Actinomadura terrae TaxID=604353 RepID=UPI001FA77766|nr:hypothetical protein [Actinomadura terrae]